MYPILAIDFGTKRLGLAISDGNGIIATPLDTLVFTKNRRVLELIDELKKVVEEYRVKSILIGKPQTFELTHDVNIRRIEDFTNTLKKRIELPIEFWDESFSTSTAKDMIVSQGQHFKNKKDRIDSLAASVFLQEYLNSKQSSNDSKID